MSIAQLIWPLLRPVLASGIPNLLLLIVITANFAWWNKTGPIFYVGSSFFNSGEVWLESFLLVGALIAVDIVAISLFARRWRARRWGRKPPEIERATRYFTG